MPASISFSARIRYWDPSKEAGLAVADIPADAVTKFGARRQLRVSGTIDKKPFTGSTMLVAGGGLCVGVSQAAMRDAGVAVGDTADFRIELPAKPSRSR
jgi:hypothetical protein